MNESIYRNVDAISSAIEENKKISFSYFEWDASGRKKMRRGGEKWAERIRESAVGLHARITGLLDEGRLAGQMESIKQVLARWDEAMSEKRISPGGCADLLAIAFFIQSVIN